MFPQWLVGMYAGENARCLITYTHMHLSAILTVGMYLHDTIVHVYNL